MKVNIQTGQVKLDKAIEAHLHRRLKLGLSRMEPYINAISICLSDVTKELDGDKVILATRCCLQISMANFPVIEVEDIQTDLYCAIDRVIQKASRTLTRNLLSSALMN